MPTSKHVFFFPMPLEHRITSLAAQWIGRQIVRRALPTFDAAEKNSETYESTLSPGLVIKAGANVEAKSRRGDGAVIRDETVIVIKT